MWAGRQRFGFGRVGNFGALISCLRVAKARKETQVRKSRFLSRFQVSAELHLCPEEARAH